MNCPKRYAIVGATALVVVAVAIYVVLKPRAAGSRHRRAPAPIVQEPSPIPSPLPPIYGPPSPRPIYGPPSPPSRVPLLDIETGRRKAVLPVGKDALRPTMPGEPKEMLPPEGWDALDLKRGIPFVKTGPTAETGPNAQGAPSEGRRILLEQAAQEMSPVTIVYCLDAAMDEAYLQAALRAIGEAVKGLSRNDRFAVVLSGTQATLAIPPTAVRDGDATQKMRQITATAKPSTAAPLAPMLELARTVSGVTDIVVIALADGTLGEEDARWFRDHSETAANGPRCIALAIGDGTPTPRARAMSSLASATHGAFAFLKPTNKPTSP